MILIVDKTITDRASALREKLYSLGCPSAVCSVRDAALYRPFRLIMTFTDVFDTVRREIPDDCRTVTIGNGFVNSALNVSRFSDADRAITAAHEYLMGVFGISHEQIRTFGVMFPPSLFVSDGFIEIYGNMVTLTSTESVILKYLIAMSDEKSPVRTQTLELYCTSDGKITPSNRVAVHISHINSKAAPYFRGELIVRSGGGYVSAVNARNSR